MITHAGTRTNSPNRTMPFFEAPNAFHPDLIFISGRLATFTALNLLLRDEARALWHAG
jgi:ABC-type enterochelin transport system substrate-binding protein